MMTQLDLFADSERPSAAEAEVHSRRVSEFLLQRGAWQTRAEIGMALGISDRLVRAAREAAPDRIIYGQRGLRAMACATADEIRACIGAYESQALRMGDAAQRLRRAAHGRVG